MAGFVAFHLRGPNIGMKATIVVFVYCTPHEPYFGGLLTGGNGGVECNLGKG